MRTRRTLTRIIYAFLGLVLLATLAVAGHGLAVGDLKATDLWASMVPVVLTVVTLVLTALQSGGRRAGGLGAAATEHASALARKVGEDWLEESRHRGLYAERRIAVRWRREPGSERSTRLSADLPDEGVLDQLTGAFARSARAGHLARLVVTGEPGAGKTALCVLLTLELAEREPVVPVLFQLSSWDPARSLAEWMTEELARNYPPLADEARGRDIAELLVRHRVLPVLDGLDEVSDPAAAVLRVQDELEGRSFVLTCRAEDFDALGPGPRLTETLLVRLQPLRADEAGGALESALGDGPQPLVAALAAQPDGPLARVLATPFMLSLAVALRGVLPAHLTSVTGPDAEDLIRRHLLGSFVERAYPRRPDRLRRGMPAARARAYLAFLARHVDRGTSRLAWWHVYRAVPGAGFALIATVNAAVGCSAVSVALFALFSRPWTGLWIGLGAALAGAMAVELVSPDDPRRAKPRLRSVRPPTAHALQRVLGFGAVGGLACAVIVLVLYGEPHYAVIGGLLSGSTFAAARHFSEPSDPMEAVTPVSLLRSDRATVLYALLLGAVPGAFTGAYLGASIKDGRRRPQLDDVTLIDHLPRGVEALLGAASGALLSATGLGLMAAGSSSWGRFLTARIWLALRGHTPWRLVAFLEDARDRGVLREVNGYYEFRHRLLQRHLAEPVPAAVPPARAVPRPGAAVPTGTSTGSPP
ncbi:NACHT domain-containing protein [Actinacidiphila rubida]|uniref:NACHT domain-containing protein n=1 Tax=Actinacidiphila rubida TaxID=310780 RepID=A0A1H8T7Q8_9ACTN|nr:AAA family ATPase [Actinacidiphila rubida]SEO86941.1 NACHT domain-containing protein [Actinacidiphila rubida]